MEKYYIHLQGTGQKNGIVTIDKKFEVDYSEIGKYTSSSTSKEYIQKAIDFYYPGLTSHNVIWAKVITEKIKVPKNPDNLEKLVVGAAAGYVAGKSEQKRTKKVELKEPEIISQDSLPYSFSQKLSVFDGLNFENCDEERTKINLKYIYDNISEYEWGDSKNDSSGIITENNRSLNICVGKFEEGLERLKKISSNDNEILYYNKLYNKLIKKRKANEPWSFAKKFFIFLLLFLLGLFLLAIS